MKLTLSLILYLILIIAYSSEQEVSNVVIIDNFT